jgi:hypothetical protein
MSSQQESVYNRYLKLHALWSNEKEWKDHIDALPCLFLAEIVEQCTDKIMVQMRAPQPYTSKPLGSP